MLTKNQIRYLKAQAHHLHPVVMIGLHGLTENVHKELNTALKSHELIKVKLGNIADDEQAILISAITSTQKANFVQKIGHTAIFFRRNKEKPRLSLPKK